MNEAKPKPGVPTPGCHSRALVRSFVVALILTTAVSTPLAQDAAETPAQSFQKFIDAVTSETLTREDKTAAFERYFDFEAWLTESETERAAPYTEEERAQQKEQWLELFHHREFRERFAEQRLTMGEPAIDREAGSATLPLTMGEPGSEKNFEVRMKLSADGTWWRWYLIPQIASEPEALTPEQRVKALEESLARIAAERERLDELEDAVRRALAKLRADKAESGDSSPRGVVTAAWTAIEAGDASALLDCHTTAQVAKVKLADVQAGIQATRERLMDWEVLQPTIDADDEKLALVPVRLKLRRTGEPDERTINVRVVRVGDTWKIDEAP
jgi:hypothetical protein